jgi:hypothetical protein
MKKLNKKWCYITGDELKEILKFLNYQINDFSTFKIYKLPTKEDCVTFESWGKGLKIKLVIERQ